METELAFQLALEGRAVLFTGAGFSRGALNLRGAEFKTGKQLAGYLASKVMLPPEILLDDAAEEFVAQHSTEKLIEELEMEFTTKEISFAHTQIARVPWKRIYTTNYDNVIEHAYHVQGQRLKSVTLGDNFRDIPKDAPLCVFISTDTSGI